MIEEQEALKSRIKVEIDAYNKELDAIATKVDEGLIKIDSAETQSLELSKAELMLRHQQFVQRILKLEEEAMLLRKELELISD